MDIVLLRKFPSDVIKIILNYKNEIEKYELGMKIIDRFKNTINKDMNYGVNIDYSYFCYNFDYKTGEYNTILFLFILLEGFIQKNTYYLDAYNKNISYLKNICDNDDIKHLALINTFIYTITMKDCIIFYNKIILLCNNFELRNRVFYSHEPYYDLDLVKRFMIYSFLNDGKTVVF